MTAQGIILLVEDNPDNMYILAHLLSRHGYAVLQAAGGLEALKLLESERPALILLDMQMPDMSGHALARTLREQPRWARVQAITS